jgi:hypothetical protein
MLAARNGEPTAAGFSETRLSGDRATVAAIIPTFNHARFLADAKQGLLSSAQNIVGSRNCKAAAGNPAQQELDLFPESNCPFYCVTVFSNKANVPVQGSTWSLMCEVSESCYRVVNQPSLVDSVVDGAVATGLVKDAQQILSRWSYRAAYGYPVPGLERDIALAQLLPEFERFGVYSRGAFWPVEIRSEQSRPFVHAGC